MPVFTQKIRENFLFLKSSFCTIEKVNYTLQSFDFRSNLTSTKKTIQNTTLDNSYQAHPFGMRQNQTPPNTGSKIKLLTSKKKEFILFEVWTDGSLHPQTAILNAINELLFEIFPYASRSDAFKYEKVYPITFHKSHTLKRREVTDLSRKHFREKFLNLEIGNFHFDLETYLFLKKIKIYRIIDFIHFFEKKWDLRTKIIGKNTILEKNFGYPLDTIRSLQSTELQYTTKIKLTLYKFQIFIYSVLTIDPVIQSSSQKSKSKG